MRASNFTHTAYGEVVALQQEDGTWDMVTRLMTYQTAECVFEKSQEGFASREEALRAGQKLRVKNLLEHALNAEGICERLAVCPEARRESVIGQLDACESWTPEVKVETLKLLNAPQEA